jgi:hypothetical protein
VLQHRGFQRASEDFPDPESPNEDDQRVARRLQIDVLKIVLPRLSPETKPENRHCVRVL